MKPLVLPLVLPPSITAPRPVTITDDVTVVELGGGVRLDVTGVVFDGRMCVILTRVQTQRLVHMLTSALHASRGL